MRLARVGGAIACALLAACAGLHPAEPPVSDLGARALADAPAFSAAALADAPVAQVADLRWWTRFDDPQLAEWVERALAANVDIAIAAERLEQARAQLQLAQADRRPKLTAQADLEWRIRNRASGSGSGDSGRDRRLQPGAALGLDMDLDLSGGLRAAERAAAAGLLREVERVDAVRLATAGLAARAVVEWRLALLEQRVLQDTVVLLRESLRIVTVRVEAGLSPVLDRERAQAELASTEAARAEAAVRAGQAFAALQVVAGLPPRPGPLTIAIDAPASTRGTAADPFRSLPALSGTQPVVQPLDLLRLRPDIRAAEQSLRVAAAEVGVAQAALSPRLRLPGSIVFGATPSGAVLGLAGATLVAALEATLLDGGTRTALREAALSRWREAELEWRRTVLLALQQVEDALLSGQGALQRMEAARRSRDAARAALVQADTLYRAGLSTYLDVADAQRSALTGERLLLQAQADAALASMRAFEAMGLVTPSGGR